MRKDGIKTGVARKPRDKGTPGVARPQPGGFPARRPGGARCRGGVSSSLALAWNRRTSRPDTARPFNWVDGPPAGERENPERRQPARGRVPMRGTGAGRLLVAMKVL